MSRAGGALPAALLLILLLGGLGGIVLSAARLRTLTAERTIGQAKVLAAAEAGLERAEAAWDPIQAGRLGVGAAQGLIQAPPSGGIVSHDTLLRLGAGLFLIRSVGLQLAADGHLLSRTALARLIRLEGPAVPDTAAALAGGDASIAADSGIRGEDAVPAGWDSACPPAGVTRLGLVHPPGAGAVLTCPGGVCVTGMPPVSTDSTLPGSLSAGLGATSLASLAAHRDAAVSGLVTPAPVLAGGSCDRTHPDNWGDPSDPGAPCGDYFPIVAAAAGTEIVAGAGQGLLLAAGDLVLSGSARFAGVVLAQGDVTLRDDAELLGTLLVWGRLVVADSARIRRSACVVARTAHGSSRPLRPVPRGTWRWP